MSNDRTRERPAGSGSYARRFSVALGLALMVLVAVQVNEYRSHGSEDRSNQSRLALGEDVEQIRYYDELLTMSARLAAASGDQSYVDRYRQAVPKLDLVIADALEQAADPAATAALEATSQANQALIALEEKSFTQLAAGNRAGAYATVSSGAYLRLKAEYTRGIDVALARMEEVGAKRDTLIERDQTRGLIVSSGLAVLILALWAATAVGLRRTSRERDQAEEQLRVQALRDPLTGLANRLLLSHRIELAGQRRHKGLTTLFYVDLDDFKLVNDEHGHPAGDLVLIEVARRLQACARPEDIVARLGGDEFAVLVENLTSDDEVRDLGQRFGAALLPPIDVEGTLVWCGASIGSAVFAEPLIESAPLPEDLLLKADLAMYQAKSAGKGRVVGFEKRMYDELVRETRLKTDLREAFERQEFTVWYQAIVDLRCGSMTGVEALVRWNHPKRGLLTPDEFLPQVAAMGLQPQLTRFVLGEACGWAKHRRARFPNEVPLTVAVNVLPQELLTAEIVGDVAQALAASGFPASLLTIEVTETATFQYLDEMLPTLVALRATGISVAIDDFGTGYSSLSHLRGLPVDLVKIDKSFVDGLATRLEASLVVAAVARLAHTMSLTIVAEGVELVKQLAALRELRCEFVQGYLLARPAPADMVPAPGEIEQRLTDLGIADLPPKPTGERFTVVVADDGEEERRLLRRMLERTGRFEVVAEATDGDEALACANALHPALVLLDLSMPRLDGMSALPLIVADVPTTRVVVLSGYATEGLGEEARRAGAAGCLDKGVADIPALLLKILEAAP